MKKAILKLLILFPLVVVSFSLLILNNSKNTLEAKTEQNSIQYSSPEKISEGKKNYMILCASCHDKDGSSKGPIGKALKARNLIKDKYKKGKSVFSIFKMLKDGIPPGMPGSQIPDDIKRWNTALYVQSLQKNKVKLSKKEISELKSKYANLFVKKLVETKKKKNINFPKIALEDLIKAYKKSGGKIVKNISAPIQVSEKQEKRYRLVVTKNKFGAYLYKTNCATCHGKYAEGRVYKSMGVNPIMTMKTKALFLSNKIYSVMQLKKAVAKGVKGLIKPHTAHFSSEAWKKLQLFVQSIARK